MTDNLRDRISDVASEHRFADHQTAFGDKCVCGWTSQEVAHSDHLADAVIRELDGAFLDFALWLSEELTGKPMNRIDAESCIDEWKWLGWCSVEDAQGHYRRRGDSRITEPLDSMNQSDSSGSVGQSADVIAKVERIIEDHTLIYGADECTCGCLWEIQDGFTSSDGSTCYDNHLAAIIVCEFGLPPT